MRRKSLWKNVFATVLSVMILFWGTPRVVFADTCENGKVLLSEETENSVLMNETESTEEVKNETSETEKTETEFSYLENEDGTISITGYDGSDMEVVIPAQISGKNVTSVGDGAFYEDKKLTRVVISEGVISIGENAFRDSAIVSIVIPESMTDIGENAFDECKNLTSIRIPQNVTSIGEEAFEECSSLTSIEVDTKNETYTSEGKNCIIEKSSKVLIQGCQNTVIPESVTSIGKHAFYGCTMLSSIALPSGVISIGDGAFERCSNLTNAEILTGIVNIGDYAFANCDSLTSITLPNSVTNIGDYAFYGSGLTDITLSNSLTDIGSYAFWGNDLTSIILPNGVNSIGENAFANCSKITEITLPDNLVYIGKAIFANCTALASVTLSEKTRYIETAAFSGCKALTSIIIPEKVTTIGAYAFYGSSLTDIMLPDSVTSIEYEAFTENSGLTIYCSINSYARQFAIENNIPYKALEEWEDSSCAHANTELRNTKAATCTEAGYTGDTYCVDCGALISSGTAVAALGHAYTGTITTQPTVTSEGVKTYTCSRCGDSYTETIAKLKCAHANTEVRNAKKATVTEAGYTGDTYCADCGELISSGITISKLIVTYTVKFDGNGADSGPMTNQKITYGSETSLSTNKFQRKGYTFKNWNTKKDGSGTVYADKADGSKLTKTNGKTVTLYAQWTANKYTITFNGNGSTSGSMKKLSNLKYSKKYTLTKNGFKKTGYTFTGWNTKKDGSGKTYKNKAEIKNLSAKSDGKVTLYAQWKKTKYTITYNLNKGKNNKSNPSSYTITTKTIKLKNPTRKGYTFKGWYSDKKCTKKVKQIKKGSTGNVTLYAKWKKK